MSDLLATAAAEVPAGNVVPFNVVSGPAETPAGTLAVARRGDGPLTLVREVTRKGKDGAEDTTSFRATGKLADIGAAIQAGIFAQ